VQKELNLVLNGGFILAHFRFEAKICRKFVLEAFQYRYAS